MSIDVQMPSNPLMIIDPLINDSAIGTNLVNYEL